MQLMSLTIDPAVASVPIGSTRALHAIGRYSDGHTGDVTAQAQWTSSSTAIATVGAMNGIARGVGQGTAVITGAVGNIAAQTTLYIEQLRVDQLTITPMMPVDLPIGMTRVFTATGIRSDGSSIDLTQDTHLVWSTSNPAAATISNLPGSNGVATGVREGATEIGATYTDLSHPAVQATAVALHVTGVPLTRINIEPGATSVPRGYTVQFRLVGEYADHHTEDLTGHASTQWTSTQVTLATISNETGSRGLATGVAPGDLQIRAQFGTLTDTANLHVSDATLAAIAVTPAAVTVTRGGSVRLRATGVFSDSTTMDLSDVALWETSDSVRAEVSNARGTAGVVTVPASATPGAVIVTARRGSISAIATVTINSVLTLRRIDIAVDQTLIPVGLTATATAAGTYSDGLSTFSRDITEQVTWNALGSATVSNAAGSSGLITGTSAGTASISATLSGVTSTTVPITVTSCPLNALRIAEGATLSMPRGTAMQLTARALYDTTVAQCESLALSYYDVTDLPQTTWSSTNSAVLSVDNTASSRGVVRAATAPPFPATADVQVRFGTLMTVAHVTVIDACVRTVRITAPSDVMPVGIVVPFHATAQMSDGSQRDVTHGVSWVSSANAVASIDARNGLVRSNAAGNSVITAQVAPSSRCAGAMGGAFNLTVNSATIAGVTVTPAFLQISRGQRTQLVATGTFSDGRVFDLTPVAAWRSSSAAIAAVAGGLVQANSSTDGNAIITAAFGSRDGFANVYVSGVRLVRIVIGIAPSFQCGTNPSGAYPIDVRVPLVATGFYSDSVARPLSSPLWISDSSAVTIDRSTGIAATLGAGTGHIRAIVGSVESDPLSISAASGAIRAVLITPPSGWVMPLGSDLQFSATGVFSGFAGSCPITDTVAWTATASSPAGLTVGSNGFATAGTGGAGAASIRAEMGSLSAVSAGNVRGACVSALVIEPPALSTPLGVRLDASASLTYSDGSRSRIAPDWSTVDQTIGRVFNGTDAFGNPVGTFVPLSVGQTTINARYTPPAGAACPGRGPTFLGSIQATVTGETLASIRVDCTINAGTDRCNFGNSTRPEYPAGITFGCRAIGTGTAGSLFDITDSAYWSSSNPGVLQVSDAAGTRGVVRAVSSGSGVIAATYGSVSDSRTVDVNNAHLEAIDVYPAGVSLPAGFTQRFGAEGTFAESGTSRRCEVTSWATWTSSNEAVVTVGTSGDYRGLASTLATSATPVNVMASFLGRTGLASVFVNDATIASVTVVPSAAVVGVGLQVGFSATGRYSDGSTRDVTASSRWSTGDSAIAVVSNALFSRGLVRGIAPGATVVRAEIGGLVSEAQLTISSACIRTLTIATRDGRLSHPMLVPSEFLAIATYSDGFVGNLTNEVKWSSSDEGIYPTPRNEQGLYVSTARAPGSATISASLNGCAGQLTARLPMTVNTALLRSIALRGAAGTDSVPIHRASQFNAIGIYSDQTAFDITSTIESWALGNTAVATLNGGGLVVGVAIGSSTLTARQGTVSGATMVTVTAATLTNLRVMAYNLVDACRDRADPLSYTDTSATAPTNAITHLRAFGTYSDQRVRDVSSDVVWSTDASSVAVVFNTPGSRGSVVTRVPGGAHLRATLMSGTVVMSSEIALTVRAGTLTALAINPGGARPIAIANGNQRQLALIGDYGSAGRYCVSEVAGWATSDGNIAAVNHGMVTALGVGSATLTAALGTLNDTVAVVVGAPTLSYLEVQPVAVTLSRWSTSRFRALAHYSDATVDDVSVNPSTLWTSTDVSGSNVLWIDPGTYSRGLVWALSPGQARIDACMGAQCAGTGTDRRAMVTVNP